MTGYGHLCQAGNGLAAVIADLEATSAEIVRDMRATDDPSTAALLRLTLAQLGHDLQTLREIAGRLP